MYIFRAKDEIDGKNEEVDGTNDNGKLVYCIKNVTLIVP
jgi:hypothetical protein